MVLINKPKNYTNNYIKLQHKSYQLINHLRYTLATSQHLQVEIEMSFFLCQHRMKDEDFQLHSLYPCNQSNGWICKVLDKKILKSNENIIIKFSH
jgi:hypothetical protein